MFTPSKSLKQTTSWTINKMTNAEISHMFKFSRETKGYRRYQSDGWLLLPSKRKRLEKNLSQRDYASCSNNDLSYRADNDTRLRNQLDLNRLSDIAQNRQQ
ncbi:hypothetical protein ElyMa_000780400 [Elysia marginata]|uniref:Fork-head domain-containing protein n=1 Tax=Elysia marginata TaxID=1093978 RepID=A0AAV4GUZ7_9GAST|nr:hypothetical protein ElyMa_000780400 [Elysia marginata]